MTETYSTTNKAGTIYWCLKDTTTFHNEYGPAVTYKHGTEFWYQNGLLHREDGPAIKTKSGHAEWYINGKRHRIDGPAIAYADGSESWWINGDRVNDPRFLRFILSKKARA